MTWGSVEVEFGDDCYEFTVAHYEPYRVGTRNDPPEGGEIELEVTAEWVDEDGIRSSISLEHIIDRVAELYAIEHRAALALIEDRAYDAMTQSLTDRYDEREP